jgi:hypothetical protein
MVTRRCTQQQFLLRPDDETNNAFTYCIIEAAQATDVQLVLAQMLSNHKHESVFPRGGTVVDFYSRFHTNLARCMNMQRGRWENFWTSRPTSAVEAVDKAAWIEQLVYIATNPVKHGLVEYVHQWCTSGRAPSSWRLCSRSGPSARIGRGSSAARARCQTSWR